MAEGARLVLLAKPDCGACDAAEPAVRSIAAALGIGWEREESADPRVPVVLLRAPGGDMGRDAELADGEIDAAALAVAARRALGR